MKSIKVGIAAAATTAVLASAAIGITLAEADGANPSHASSHRPNIVFVLTDDLSMNLISHMPHVQQMQRTGTTMANNYVVDSLCCPSRTATLTGEYPHDDGVFTNTGGDGGYGAFQSHDNAKRTYGLALQRNGYRTAFMGKYLNGYQPSDPVPAGWNEWDVAGNGYPEFNYDLNENGKTVHYGKAPKDYLTDVLSAKAQSFIRSSSTPFALEVATFAPHAPYTPAPRDVGSAATQAYPKTAAYDTTPTDAPSWLGSRPDLTTAQKTKLLKSYRKRVAAVQSVDDMIGNLQKTLQATGKAKNTYVVFSSDNGYHMGEYKLLAGKQTAFDTDIHVPLVVTGPAVPAGSTSKQLTSNIDLAPTFEKLTGSKIDSKADGVDMSALWHGHTSEHWQQGVLIEHHGPDTAADDPDRQTKAAANPPSYEAIRTGSALYVEYANGDREYYDTRTDPDELHNLASKGVPASLPTQLHALEKCSGAAACQRAVS